MVKVQGVGQSRSDKASAARESRKVDNGTSPSNLNRVKPEAPPKMPALVTAFEEQVGDDVTEILTFIGFDEALEQISKVHGYAREF